ARVLVPPTSAPLFHQAAASQQIPRRTDRGQRQVRMPGLEPVQQLLRTPARVLPTRVTDQLRHDIRHAMRTLVRRAGTIAQPTPALFVEPSEPLVALSTRESASRALRMAPSRRFSASC